MRTAFIALCTLFSLVVASGVEHQQKPNGPGQDPDCPPEENYPPGTGGPGDHIPNPNRNPPGRNPPGRNPPDHTPPGHIPPGHIPTGIPNRITITTVISTGIPTDIPTGLPVSGGTPGGDPIPGGIDITPSGIIPSGIIPSIIPSGIIPSGITPGGIIPGGIGTASPAPPTSSQVPGSNDAPSQCNSGQAYCCNSMHNPRDLLVKDTLRRLARDNPLDLSDLLSSGTGLAGLQCNPISIPFGLTGNSWSESQLPLS